MPSAYIVNGRIERGGAKSLFGVRTQSFQFFSWGRFLFLVGAVGILVATNPANLQLFRPKKDLPPRSSSFTFNSLFGLYEEQTTNYLFFAVKETPQSLIFMVLGESWNCRYDDSDIGPCCLHFSEVTSHGKPVLWDPSDVVHTVHRTICFSLILSAAIAFCFPNAPGGRLFDNPFLDCLFSVFYQPNLLYDIMHANLALYPALIEMRRILPLLRPGSTWSRDDSDVDFALWTILLVMGIGGGSNWIAAQLLAREDCIAGFSTVVAASLAYCHRTEVFTSPLSFLFEGLRQVSAADVFWTELVVLLLRGSRNSFSMATAWLIGGFLGSSLAKYHLENIVVWGGILKFLGWT